MNQDTEPVAPYKYPRLTPAQVRLYNAVSAALPPDGRVSLSAHPHFERVLELGLKFSGMTVNLQIGDDAFLQELDELKGINPAALPPELKNAAAQLLFERELKALGAYLDANVMCGDTVPSDTPQGQLDLLWQRQERFLPLRFVIPDTPALEALLEHLGRHRAAWPLNPALSKLKALMHFHCGEVKISLQEYRTLECGDVLIPDSAPLDLNKPYCRLGSLVLKFTQGEGGAVLSALAAAAEDDFSPFPGYKRMTDSTAQSSQAVDAGGLEFTVGFEVDRRLMTVEEISALRVGAVIALNCDHDAPVTLRAGGMDIGRGRLVDMGGTLGVQITALNGKTAPAES